MVNMFAVRRAFQELEGLGYFAPSKKFMCCGNCAVHEIASLKGADFKKFVYFHEQSHARMREGDDLYIGWAGEASVIRDCFTHQGLVVDHDGTDGMTFIIKASENKKVK